MGADSPTSGENVPELEIKVGCTTQGSALSTTGLLLSHGYLFLFCEFDLSQ